MGASTANSPFLRTTVSEDLLPATVTAAGWGQAKEPHPSSGHSWLPLGATRYSLPGRWNQDSRKWITCTGLVGFSQVGIKATSHVWSMWVDEWGDSLGPQRGRRMDTILRERQRWEAMWPQREMARVGTSFPGSWDTGIGFCDILPVSFQ